MSKAKELAIVDKVLSVVVDQNLEDVGEGRVRVATANGSIRVLIRYYKTGEMHIVAENGNMSVGSSRPRPAVVVTPPVALSKS
jgi:hypothetical protein